MLQGKQNKFNFFLISILGLIISQLASAQENFRKEFNLGVNGGVSISSMSFSPNSKVRQNNLSQATGGLSFRYVSENNFGLQSEINYSQRGWKEFDAEKDPSVHYTRALDYIELPVLTHIFFDVGKHFRVVFNLGPQLGFLLNERITEDSNIDTSITYYTQKVQRRFDWGLCFGGGIELRTDKGNFILDGRYYYGLSDVFTNSKVDTTYYFAASSNQVICIKLTYLFSISQ